jgi:hypothetical protein
MFLFNYIKRLFCYHLELINNNSIQGTWNVAKCKNCRKPIELFTLFKGKF